MEDGTATQPDAGLFRFKTPGNPWRQDKETQLGLKVNPAYRRNDPSNVLALHFKDFKDRLPTDADMVDEALSKLRGYFAPFEWELKAKSDDDSLGGQPTRVMIFEGSDPNQVPMAGECWMLAHHGVGYWFVHFGPSEQRDEISPEWEKLRQGFSLTNKREGWKPKPRPTDTFKGETLSFRVTAFKDVWKKRTVDDETTKVELYLEGTFDPRAKDQHAGNKAFLQAVALPKATDLKAATDVALKYVAEREKMMGNEKATVEPIKNKAGTAGKTLKVGSITVQRMQLGVKTADDEMPTKYVDLTVANLGGGTLALIGECPWGRREYWEQQFTPLIESLRVKE